MKERKLVSKQIEAYVDTDFLYGSVDNAIDKLNELKEVYEHGGKLHWMVDSDSDGCIDIELYTERLETDKEYDARVQLEAIAQERRMAAEKKHLATLLEKYGDIRD